MPRIKLENSTPDNLVAMCKGNPGALTVCIRLLKEGADIDPRNMFGGWGPILNLDSYGIYEERIWMLYKDVCKQDLPKMVAMLRALQLGIVSREIMDHAIDNYGKGLDVDATCAAVKEQLPDLALTKAA